MGVCAGQGVCVVGISCSIVPATGVGLCVVYCQPPHDGQYRNPLRAVSLSHALTHPVCDNIAEEEEDVGGFGGADEDEEDDEDGYASPSSSFYAS